MKPKITAEGLKALVSYDPETGVFVRVAEARGAGKIGERAGWLGGYGYWYLSVGGRMYSAHRLAWLYMTGEWPARDIDHANGDRADNRWSNLRSATRAQNLTNCKRKSTNKSGWKGVCRQPGASTWRATISVNRKQIALGSFRCPAAAHLAYVVAASQHYGEFARSA